MRRDSSLLSRMGHEMGGQNEALQSISMPSILMIQLERIACIPNSRFLPVSVLCTEHRSFSIKTRKGFWEGGGGKTDIFKSYEWREVRVRIFL